MAYDTTKEKQEIFGSVPKNDRGDFVQVSKITPLSENTNRVPAVDIRLMYTTEDGTVRPTNKGVRIHCEMVADVAKALLDSLTDEEFKVVAKHIEGRMAKV